MRFSSGRARRGLLPLLSVAVLLVAHPDSVASLTIIDNFEEGDFSITDPVGPPATLGEQAGLLNSNVRGGVRLVRVAAIGSITGLEQGQASLTTSPADDGVAFSTIGASSLTRFDFIYDGIANGDNDGTAGLLNLNLSGSSELSIDSSGLASGVTVELAMWDSTSVGSISAPFSIGTMTLSLLGLGLDLSDIRAIRVGLDKVDVFDVFTVDQIYAVPVPEPGTALLLGLGLIGVAARRRSSMGG